MGATASTAQPCPWVPQEVCVCVACVPSPTCVWLLLLAASQYVCVAAQEGKAYPPEVVAKLRNLSSSVDTFLSPPGGASATEASSHCTISFVSVAVSFVSPSVSHSSDGLPV